MNDDDLDTLLRADAGHTPADAGFSQRLLARLPPRRRPPATSRLPARAAQLCALSTAALGALLLPAGPEAWLPGVCLLGLVLWWSLPQSRGGLFRAV